MVFRRFAFKRFAVALAIMMAACCLPWTDAYAAPEDYGYADAHRVVYVSKSGVYHYVSDCSGMQHYTSMELQSARASNYRPCSNCVTSANLPLYPFPDVNSGTSHLEDIMWLKSQGITQGYEDGTFKGLNSVYRQDMAAFLRRLAINLGDIEAASWMPSEDDWSCFKDVNRSTPHVEDILWLASTGISEGYEDGTYRPMTQVYRQDMAAFLRRLCKHLNDSSAINWAPSEGSWRFFKDVNSKTPHVEDILWMGETGISKGYDDGTYRGLTPVYRQDMAAFLHRLAERF